MSWTFVVLALVLFLFAIYIGFLCGKWACEKRVITKRDYWIANFAGAAAVVLLTWVFSLFPLVQFAPIGWLGGFIAGLKMSFGESVVQRRGSALGLSQRRFLDRIARIRSLYHCPIDCL